jgi:hypothetical protein
MEDCEKLERLFEKLKGCDDLVKGRLIVDLATRSKGTNDFAWWAVSKWHEDGTEEEFELGCDLMKFLCCIDTDDPEDVEWWREIFRL